MSNLTTPEPILRGQSVPPLYTPPDSGIVARLQKLRKMKTQQPLPSPIVVQLIEMGFVRKRVEQAVKHLGQSEVKERSGFRTQGSEIMENSSCFEIINDIG